MADTNDIALLREYLDGHSETAFARLVQQHVNLIYSVALRYTGNSHDAQDVAQAVFVILAKKAASLRHRTNLTGWLYETTRFTCSQFLRTRARQQAREQEAYLQSTLNNTETEVIWRQLAPLLEEAMTRLSEKERTLIALRFFENKSAAETSALLGIQEWAAHKRAARSLEKLRQFFAKRGIVVSVAILSAAISANSVQAAPAALAKAATSVAVAKGATASTLTSTLIKGALNIMAWTKMKTAVVMGVAVILTATTTTVIIGHRHPTLAQASVGYATPEAAFQTGLWALNQGDLKAFLASITPALQDHFLDITAKGKSETEISAMMMRMSAEQGTSFKIIRNEVVSKERLIMHVRSLKGKDGTVRVIKIGKEWKVDSANL